MRRSVQIEAFVLLVLLLITLAIWYAAMWESRRGILTVSFLAVGQGDAIFIQAPSGRQALIDGGPDSSVLRKLGEVLPWYDRSIDVVVGTHPDADHIGGLVDVIDRYAVSHIVQSSVQGSTPISEAFERAIASEQREGAQVLVAQRGQIIDLGGGAYLEVLSPDRELLHAETNLACVVARLVYGKTAFMLPCDAPQSIETYLVALDGVSLRSDVLKAAHHGSKTSSSALFLGYVDPAYGVYSRGCENSYGHPNEETKKVFARFGIPTLDTCTDGTITFVSDGQTVNIR